MLAGSSVGTFRLDDKQVRDNPLAGLESRDVSPYRDDGSSGLMTGNVRQARNVGQAVLDVQIGPADAACVGLDEYLVGPDLRDRHLLDYERFTDSMEHGRLHHRGRTPSW